MNVTLQTLEKRLAASIREVDSVEMQTHPPSKWSIQQIVEHLILTYSATEKVLSSRIAKGRATQTRPSFWQHCGQIFVLRFGYFPAGLPAPAEVTPVSDSPALSGERLAAAASERLKHMDELLDEVSALFGEGKQSASHIRLGPLSPSQWRRFHLVHGLHHIGQIEAIRRNSRSTAPRQATSPLHR